MDWKINEISVLRIFTKAFISERLASSIVGSNLTVAYFEEEIICYFTTDLSKRLSWLFFCLELFRFDVFLKWLMQFHFWSRSTFIFEKLTRNTTYLQTLLYKFCNLQITFTIKVLVTHCTLHKKNNIPLSLAVHI